MNNEQNNNQVDNYDHPDDMRIEQNGLPHEVQLDHNDASSDDALADYNSDYNVKHYSQEDLSCEASCGKGCDQTCAKHAEHISDVENAPEGTSAGHSSEDILKAVEGKKVYKIKIINSSCVEYCVLKKNLKLNKGDFVIVPTRYGKDLGKIEGKVDNLKEIGVNEVYAIERIASKDDLKLFAKNKQKNEEAFNICKEKISRHNLEMKLVSAHYLLGEQKILFFFTAESRVDFRELVKDLVSVFKTRIELRQIGVRDEARVLGGIGVCGREYCCHNLRDKLDTVSIKMAKKQNLSLNSLKISGPCGRLLCCLAYEYSYYNDARHKMPEEGIEIFYENENCKIMEVNVITEKIILSSVSGRILAIPFDSFIYNTNDKKWIIKD
jgi:cell fate regulator YaaT (PSP1 superfamily)